MRHVKFGGTNRLVTGSRQRLGVVRRKMCGKGGRYKWLIAKVKDLRALIT